MKPYIYLKKLWARYINRCILDLLKNNKEDLITRVENCYGVNYDDISYLDTDNIVIHTMYDSYYMLWLRVKNNLSELERGLPLSTSGQIEYRTIVLTTWLLKDAHLIGDTNADTLESSISLLSSNIKLLIRYNTQGYVERRCKTIFLAYIELTVKLLEYQNARSR